MSSAWSASTSSAATERGTGPLLQSTARSGPATEQSEEGRQRFIPIIEVAFSEGSVEIIEDVLVDVIPFLTMEVPAHTNFLRTGEGARKRLKLCDRANQERVLQSRLPSAQLRHTVTQHVFIEALA